MYVVDHWLYWMRQLKGRSCARTRAYSEKHDIARFWKQERDLGFRARSVFRRCNPLCNPSYPLCNPPFEVKKVIKPSLRLIPFSDICDQSKVIITKDEGDFPLK